MTRTIDVKRYTFTPETQVRVESIDLDAESVTVGGRRYTEADAARDAQSLESRQRAGLLPGGKSLSGDGSHSPIERFTLSRATRDKLKQVASEDHMSRSRWVRHLVERELANR